MVLLIAGVPALVVVLVGWYTKSKWRTRIAALAAAALGVLTGSPIYTVLDVAFVVIGYLLAMKFVVAEQKRIEAHVRELQAQRERRIAAAKARLAAHIAAERLAKAAIDAARKPNAPRGE